MNTKRHLVMFDHGTENSKLILEDLFNKSKETTITFSVSAVVSYDPISPLFEKAEELGIPYYYFQTEDDYKEIKEKTKGDLFLFYNWGRELALEDINEFGRSNLVSIFPGPWELKGVNIGDYKNIHEFLVSNKKISYSAFSVYFYGKNQNDLSNLFSFVKVPLNNVYDGVNLERKVIKAGICKLSSLLDLVVKGHISLNEKGCLVLPNGWGKETARVNSK